MAAAANSVNCAADSAECTADAGSQTGTEPGSVARIHHHLALRTDGIQTRIEIRGRLVGHLLRALNGRSRNSVHICRVYRRGRSIRQFANITGDSLLHR